MERNWVVKLMPRWEKGRHSQVWARVRFASGCWLLVLTAILYGYDRAGWWTPLLILAAGGHFYAAYVLRQLTNARKANGLAA